MPSTAQAEAGNVLSSRSNPVFWLEPRRPKLDSRCTQPPRHCRRTHANALSDCTSPKPCCVHFFDAVDRDVQSVMVPQVIALPHDGQIRWIVIEAIAVDMVHMLIISKPAAKPLFDDVPVLRYGSSIPCDRAVAKLVRGSSDPLSSFVMLASAFGAAEETRLVTSPESMKGCSAVETCSFRRLYATSATEVLSASPMNTVFGTLKLLSARCTGEVHNHG